MRDLSDVLGAAVDARALALDGLAPAAGLAGLRTRVRRRRAVRHTLEAVAVLPVVAAIGVGGWLLLESRDPMPPVISPTPTVEPTPEPTRTPRPTPTPSPTPTATPESVLGDPITEPGVPTYYAMPDGLLDQVGAGWVLASFAPRGIDGTPTSEVILAVSPEGVRFELARFETGSGTTWVEHVPVQWDGGGTAIVEVVAHAITGSSEPTASERYVELDLASGALGGPATPNLPEDDGMVRAFGPDGRSVVGETYSDRFTLESDGASVEVSYGVDGRVCFTVGWLDASSLLALCVDEAGADPLDGWVQAPWDHDPVLFRVPLDGGSSERLVEVGADDPWPQPNAGVWVSDGVVAFPAVERAMGACWTGAGLWADGKLQPVQAPTGRGENYFLVRAQGGVVFVDATGGCSGDEVPRSLTAHDVASGASIELLPAPEGSWIAPAADGAWLRTLTGWVVAE